MTKKSVKSIIIVLMILTIALYFVSGTYARYTDTWSGTGNVDVAKWAVKLTEKGEDLATQDFELTFTPDENTYVADGKIAPASTATAEIELDLTNTEVAVDVEAAVDQEKVTEALSALGASASNITTEVKLKKGEEVEGTAGKSTIELVGGEAFTAENGKRTVEISIKWDNKDDAQSVSDTAAGKTAAASGLTLKIPVKLTVKQHIQE